MRINIEETCLFVVDVQEKLFPFMNNSEQLLNNIQILIEGSNILDIPVIITEQVPEKLGRTKDEILDLLLNNTIFSKHYFSCYGCEGIKELLNHQKYKNVLICGMETHICVLQTAIDLKEANYNPIIIWDAVSSRMNENKNIALERIRQEGIMIMSIESILFELLQTFNHPDAKDISKLIK